EDPGNSRVHGPLDRKVVSAGVPEGLAGRYDGEGGGRHLFERGERGTRPVLRGVVQGHDREIADRLREKRWQQALDIARFIVRDDRDEDARRRHEERPFGRGAEPHPKPRSPRTTRACAAAASPREWSGRTKGRRASLSSAPANVATRAAARSRGDECRAR